MAVVIPASAAVGDESETGTLVVTLTNSWDSQPSSGGCITAVNALNAEVQTCAGAAGVYTLSGLEPGEYRIKASNFSGGATNQFSGPAQNIATATALTVTAGASTEYSLTIYPPYAVIGTVVDSNNDPVGPGTLRLYESGEYTTIDVAADGAYLFATTSCSLGACELRFVDFDGFVDSWYLNQSTAQLATYFSPSASRVTVLSPQVMSTSPEPASITGTFTPPSYFTSDEMCVVLYEKQYNFNLYGLNVGTACGQAGEPFEFGDLGASLFALCYIDAPTAEGGCKGNPKANRYGTDEQPFTFPLITVAGEELVASSTFGTSVTLRALGSDGATKLTDGCVDLYTDSLELVDTQCAAAGGDYEFDIANDVEEYRAYYRDFGGYRDAWQNLYSAGFWHEIVDGVPVEGSRQLQPWTSITGHIDLPSGTAATTACVFAFDRFGAYASGPHFSEACIDAEGNYELPLPDGEYQLQFFADSDDVAFEWYDNFGVRSGAAWVRVSPYQTTVANASLARAAIISGTVSAVGGGLVSDGCVIAYRADGAFVSKRCVASDGSYTLDSLPAGTYVLQFVESTTHGSTWFGGATFESATRHTVAAGASRTANVSAPSLGQIVGTVSSASGPLTGGCVSAYSTAGIVADQECGEMGDSYSLSVPPGSYSLLFSGWGDGGAPTTADTWWPSASNVADAGVVTVTAGGVVTRDIALDATFGVLDITADLGTYVAWQEAPTTGCVSAYDLDGDLVSAACVDENGHAVLQLSVSPVRLLFSGYEFTHAGGHYPAAFQWDGQYYSFDTAPTRSVVVGETTAAHVSLAPSTAYRLTVRGNGVLATSGTVELYDAATGDFLASRSLVGTGGIVTFEHLITDSRVQAYVYGVPGMPPTWSGGTSAYGRAAQVDLGPEWVTTAETMDLYPGGSISGRLLVPDEFEGEVCARAWQYVGTPAQWYFVAEDCGPIGSAFTIGPMARAAWDDTFFVDFVDAAGRVVDYNEVIGWGASSPIRVDSGENVHLDQNFVYLKGPERFWLGQTIRLTAKHFGANTGTAVLWQSVDGSTWTPTGITFPISGGAGSVVVTPSSSRYYGIEVGGLGSNIIHVERFNPTWPSVSRVGGESRYDVAVGISQEYFPGGADTVYIATGANFPDALGAAPAAALRDAPLLLVPGTAIPASVQTELARLDPDTIIVTGGPASVSNGVLAQLGAYASTVVRISGDDRYEVSRLVTRDAFEGVGSDVAYIATGATFPDALSASAAAGSVDAPVILVYGLASTLDAKTRQLLIDLGVNEIRIAGGPASVSPGIETGLRNVPGVTAVSRLSGEDRFVVSGATNRAAFTSADTVFIASGFTFPDALAGAAVAGAEGAPLYVIPSSCIPHYVLEDIVDFGATTVKIFGGPASVTPAAAALRRC